MDVSNKLSAAMKVNLTTKVLEFQVLTNLQAERRAILQDMGKQALTEVGISPEQFDLEVDPQNGVFNVREKPGTVTSTPVPQFNTDEAKPAGDTETELVAGEVRV